MGISEIKSYFFFKIAHSGETFLDCVLNVIIASKNWESSKVEAFGKITWVLSRKYVILFSIALPSNFFEQCVSKGTSVSKISKMFNFGFFGKEDGFSGKKL